MVPTVWKENMYTPKKKKNSEPASYCRFKRTVTSANNKSVLVELKVAGSALWTAAALSGCFTSQISDLIQTTAGSGQNLAHMAPFIMSCSS